MNDLHYMKEAYREAVAAGERGECPVGAVVVKDGLVIARAGNEELARNDPTAHAEILCLRRAGKALGQRFLIDCTIYTTLWPCPMCQGAMLQAQVFRVVSGANTFKWILKERFDFAKLEMVGPVLETQCRKLFVDWARRNGRFEILDGEQG